ncbi:MAG: hypothetical protein IPK60_21040 [Sandaracinaceae bacterium]|nr:hypothetical protein [Sandaracinaceae bacterium]
MAVRKPARRVKTKTRLTPEGVASLSESMTSETNARLAGEWPAASKDEVAGDLRRIAVRAALHPQSAPFRRRAAELLNALATGWDSSDAKVLGPMRRATTALENAAGVKRRTAGTATTAEATIFLIEVVENALRRGDGPEALAEELLIAVARRPGVARIFPRTGVATALAKRLRAAIVRGGDASGTVRERAESIVIERAPAGYSRPSTLVDFARKRSKRGHGEADSRTAVCTFRINA